MHKEFIRINKESEYAVLFIHGIIGTPDHFEQFIPLVPQNWSIYNILLDGHGGRVENFSHTSMKKWKSQVRNRLAEICSSHSNVIVAAHSMGSLFAIQSFTEFSENIRAMFFIQPPIKLGVKPHLIGVMYKVLYNRIKPDDFAVMAANKAYSMDRDKCLVKYLGWIPRYLELFREIPYTRGFIEDIKVPVYVFLSAKDEMVSLSGIKYLKANPYFHVKILKNSTHFYYEDRDYKRILTKFQAVIKEVSTSFP